MSLDSLLRDLQSSQQSSERFGTGIISELNSEALYTGRVRKRAREVVSAAQLSLYQRIPRDYSALVNLLADCPIPIVEQECIEKGQHLGSGYTMSVYEGSWKTSLDYRKVALKYLNLEFSVGMSSEEFSTHDFRLKLASLILEIRMMTHELLRSHRNIVRLLGISWVKQNVAFTEQLTTPVLIAELSTGNDGQPFTLESLIGNTTTAELPLVLKGKLLSDIASGIAALHALGVVHGDLKPANVLLFTDSTGLTAKISDFGFCIVDDDDLKVARGGTAYWNAPECMADAPTDIRAYRIESPRDLYSFGLLIWFVLFEEFPFRGSEKSFDKQSMLLQKLRPSMKSEIDQKFFSRYRLVARPHQLGNADTQRDSTNHCQFRFLFAEEQFDVKTQRWMDCTDSLQHVLRFLMQWLLVRSPAARALAFDQHRRLLHDKNLWRVAKEDFQTVGKWNLDWAEYGNSSIRFLKTTIDRRQRLHDTSLYWLSGTTEVADWGRLKQFEKATLSSRVAQLQVKSVPVELQRDILSQSLQIITGSSGSLRIQHLKLIGDCYNTGFGVAKNHEEAAVWFQRASDEGDPEASKAFLQICGPEAARARLGDLQYCKVHVQVLLATFSEGGLKSRLLSTELREKHLSVLETTLCRQPDLSRIPLEHSVKLYTEHRSIEYLEKLHDDSPFLSPAWHQAIRSIVDDDQQALRSAIEFDPSILHVPLAGMNDLVSTTIRWRRAGLLRLLIEEYGIETNKPNVKGLTPLEEAIRINDTASVRVLLFASKQLTVNLENAAMSNASEGKPDLTRIFYTKFIASSDNAESEREGSDRLQRWSFYALATATLNNNWGVFCALLDLGVDPNTTNPSITVGATTFFATTLLAATIYNPLMLAAALTFGASPHMRVPYPDARTALHLACGRHQDPLLALDADNSALFHSWSFQRTQIPAQSLNAMQEYAIWVLIEFGADIEARDYHGNTPIMYALENGRDLCAATFLMSQNPSPDINATNFAGNTALHAAVRDENLDRVKFCLHCSADLEARTAGGETALALAVKEGNQNICGFLVAAGADIGALDLNGQNCFCIALWKSQLGILSFFETTLRERSPHALGEIILHPDCRGWNTIHTCIMNSASDEIYIAILERWIESMPELDINDQDNPPGWTLLHFAVASSNTCTVLLLQHGADPNIPDSVMGWTPLHHACNEGNFDALNLLLEHGGDFYARDSLMGWTPLVCLEQATDRGALDERHDFEDSERERLAQRRSRLRERAGGYQTAESMRRMVRPVTQVQVDRFIEERRREAFPAEAARGDEGGGYVAERNLRWRSIVDGRGRWRGREVLFPEREGRRHGVELM
ncbi:Ankyrin-2 [Trapelia coarctata]|nr:Ankyrin-2 [Trapelia coarctata]